MDREINHIELIEYLEATEWKLFAQNHYLKIYQYRKGGQFYQIVVPIEDCENHSKEYKEEIKAAIETLYVKEIGK